MIKCIDFFCSLKRSCFEQILLCLSSSVGCHGAGWALHRVVKGAIRDTGGSNFSDLIAFSCFLRRRQQSFVVLLRRLVQRFWIINIIVQKLVFRDWHHHSFGGLWSPLHSTLRLSSWSWWKGFLNRRLEKILNPGAFVSWDISNWINIGDQWLWNQI